MIGFLVTFALAYVVIQTYSGFSPGAKFAVNVALALGFTLFFTLMWRTEILQVTSDALFQIFAAIFDLIILMARALVGLERAA